jgi:hypothetical protein
MMIVSVMIVADHIAGLVRVRGEAGARDGGEDGGLRKSCPDGSGRRHGARRDRN